MCLDTRPNIHVVDVIDIKSDARTAFDKTQELMALTGPKKINAFVCLESASGKMVSDAIKRTNATDRVVVAWDVNQDTLDGIKGGTINATVAQKPFTMGYIGLTVAGRDFPCTADVVDDGLQPGCVFSIPCVYRYGYIARGQAQCGFLHCIGSRRTNSGSRARIKVFCTN